MNNKIKPCFIYCGRHDYSNMHSWGPGVRTNYIIHYIIRGKGTFVNGGKTYALSAGQSFLIRPFTEVCYFPDSNDPWAYTWIDFAGELLERGSSVKSTALSCGFQDPLYFSKVFSSALGISPREYRRRFINK